MCGATSKNNPNSIAKKLPERASPPFDKLSLQSESSWEVPPTPIWRAESNDALHFVVPLLVVTPQAKTFQISDFQNSVSTSSPLAKSVTIYSQNPVEGCFRTFQARWIRWWPPFYHSTAVCRATCKNVPNSASGIVFLQCIWGGFLLLACFSSVCLWTQLLSAISACCLPFK